PSFWTSPITVSSFSIPSANIPKPGAVNTAPLLAISIRFRVTFNVSPGFAPWTYNGPVAGFTVEKSISLTVSSSDCTSPEKQSCVSTITIAPLSTVNTASLSLFISSFTCSRFIRSIYMPSFSFSSYFKFLYSVIKNNLFPWLLLLHLAFQQRHAQRSRFLASTHPTHILCLFHILLGAFESVQAHFVKHLLNNV